MRHCGTAPVADRVGQILADRVGQVDRRCATVVLTAPVADCVGQVDRRCVTGTESNVGWHSPRWTKGEGLSSDEIKHWSVRGQITPTVGNCPLSYITFRFVRSILFHWHTFRQVSSGLSCSTGIHFVEFHLVYLVKVLTPMLPTCRI